MAKAAGADRASKWFALKRPQGPRYGRIAKIRVGAPVPLPIFIGIQNNVAPVDGSLSAFATFSNAGLFAPSQCRCTGNSFELPGSILAVSIAIAETLRFCSR